VVRISAKTLRRPDVTIECGEGDRRDMAVVEPRAFIEVLSPSTMNFDRVSKLGEYQSVPSMTHILLVDTEQPRIDVCSREADGSWRTLRYDGLDAKLELPAVGACLALADVYERLAFEPRPA
jgi:Uma2 family endonuclease